MSSVPSTSWVRQPTKDTGRRGGRPRVSRQWRHCRRVHGPCSVKEHCRRVPIFWHLQFRPESREHHVGGALRVVQLLHSRVDRRSRVDSGAQGVRSRDQAVLIFSRSLVLWACLDGLSRLHDLPLLRAGGSPVPSLGAHQRAVCEWSLNPVAPRSSTTCSGTRWQ